MPTRRFHSKSRNGCQQCKISRVKCDEARPTCKHCARRRLQCDYSAFRHLRSVKRPTAQTLAELRGNFEKRPVSDGACSLRQNEPHETLEREANMCHAYESNILSPQGELTGPTRKKFELRLIHNFIALIVPVQASQSSARAAQQKTSIPLLAMKYVYARDIILGCSALYLREFNPTDILLVEASHAYTLRAIAECSRQIQTGVDESNAEGLFFTSMFVAKHALGSRKYDNITKENSLCKQDILPLVQWLRQFRGIQAVLDAGWAWISQNKDLSPMLDALTVLEIKSQVHGATPVNILLEGLEDPCTSSTTVEVYRAAVEYLNSVIQTPNFRGLAGFLIAVPDRFFPLLEERDPRAMAIIGWYLALFVVASKSGVLMLAAKREYSIVIEQLPAKWIPKMDQAARIMECCSSY